MQDAKPLDSLSAEEARAIFAAIDTDKSGEITIDELRAYMRREDPSVTEEQVQRRYVYLNADGQGTLTAEDFAERHVCDKKPPAVELHGYYAEAVVQKLQSTSWKELRMVITPDVLALGPAVGGGYDDVIPLYEICGLRELSEGGREEGGWNPLKSICLIYTGPGVGMDGEGYNLGRKYCIASDFPMDIHEGKAEERMRGIGQHVTDGKLHTCGDFVKFLQVLVSQAKARHKSHTLNARFIRSRLFVRRLFKSSLFQIGVGILLISNFAMSAFEAQMRESLVLDDGSPSTTAAFLDIADVAFLVIFTVELALNLYAHWMSEFLADGWSCFDFVVVCMGIIAPFMSNSPSYVALIFRLFRSFRVLRLFGRLKSIRKIVDALTASVLPVTNAFFIMFVVLMLYAILGVNLLSEKSPANFGKFDRAVATMFRIAAGETWVDGMEVYNEELGTVNWVVGAYVFSFIVIVVWTLLQVTVAVLLDNFVSETSREKEEAYQLSVREKRIQDNIGNVLDPLLKIIAKEYIDHASLTSSLSQIFHFMLTAVGAQNELTCNDMIRGISKMNFTDEYDKNVTFRMHMTKMDYDTITEQGALAKDNGALGAAEFDTVLRKQVHDYIKRKLQRSVSETDTLENFAKFASLKALVMDVEAIKAIQSEMRSEIKAFHLASELQGENCREMMHVQMKEMRSEILSEIQSEMKALHLAVSLAAGHSLGGTNVCEPAVCADAPKAVIFSRREKRHEKRESAQGGTAVIEARRMAEEEENVRSAAVELAERISAEDEERKTRLSRRHTMPHIQALSSTTGEGLPYRREWELSASNASDTLAAMLPVPSAVWKV